MIVSRPSPLERITSTYSRCAAVSGVSSSIVVMPITPFIGVRISWLMLARNVLFALAAASAESLRDDQRAIGGGHFIAQPADVATHEGEPRQRDGQHDQLQDLVCRLDGFGLESIERRDHQAVGADRGGGQEEQLIGAQPEDAEQEGDEEDDQQRRAAVIGVIHDERHRHDRRRQLRHGQAGVAELQVEPGADDDVEDRDPEDDQRGALDEARPLEAAQQEGDIEQDDHHQRRAGGHDVATQPQGLAFVVRPESAPSAGWAQSLCEDSSTP